MGVDEDEAPDIDIYHCPNCEKTHGKSTCKYLYLNLRTVNELFWQNKSDGYWPWNEIVINSLSACKGVVHHDNIF